MSSADPNRAAEVWTQASWMVRMSGEHEAVGPVSLDQIKRGIDHGKLSPGAEVAPQGTRDWQSSKTLLASVLAQHGPLVDAAREPMPSVDMTTFADRGPPPLPRAAPPPPPPQNPNARAISLLAGGSHKPPPPPPPPPHSSRAQLEARISSVGPPPAPKSAASRPPQIPPQMPPPSPPAAPVFSPAPPQPAPLLTPPLTPPLPPQGPPPMPAVPPPWTAPGHAAAMSAATPMHGTALAPPMPPPDAGPSFSPPVGPVHAPPRTTPVPGSAPPPPPTAAAPFSPPCARCGSDRVLHGARLDGGFALLLPDGSRASVSASLCGQCGDLRLTADGAAMLFQRFAPH